MQKSQFGLSNPIDMVYHVQPLMILCLLPFAVAFEGTRISASIAVFRFQETFVFFHTLALIGTGGVIAFGMEVAEFLLVSYTSGLTLSVAGIIKEIISLTLAIIYQSSDISVINMIGLVICMLGITLHVVRKATQVEKPEKSGTGRFLRREGAGNTTLPLLSDSDTDSETEIYHTTSQGPSSGGSRAITEVFRLSILIAPLTYYFLF